MSQNRISETVIQLWNNKIFRHQFLIILISFSLILILPNRLDYTEYEKQWIFILNGGNPWDFGSNAYGPLHVLMALLYMISPKLPHLIFSLCAFFSSFYLFQQIYKSSHFDAKEKKKLKLFLFYNPIIWIFVVIIGCNDGLVGSLFLFGVILYDRKKFIPSALLLSLAIFYKYFPLFIIPFLCIHSKKINWKFSFSMFTFLGVGIGSTCYIWGNRFFHSLLHTSGRYSKMLSIFRYLRGDFSVLKLFRIDDVDYLSRYILIASILLFFIIHILLNLEYYYSLVISLLLVFMIFPVGHFQFYISAGFILIYFILKYRELLASHLKLRNKLYFFLYWISSVTILYGVTEGFYNKFKIIREFIGLPHFIILTILTVSLIHFAIQTKNKSMGTLAL